MQRAAFANPDNPYNNYGPGIRDFQKDAVTASQNRTAVGNQPRLAPLAPIKTAPLANVPVADASAPPIRFDNWLADTPSAAVTQKKQKQQAAVGRGRLR